MMALGRFQIVVVLVGCISLTACGGNSTRDLLAEKPVAASEKRVSGQHRIFVATTRAKAKRTQEIFDGRRSPEASFAAIDMTVPAVHRTGEIERRKKGQAADPAKFFVAKGVDVYSGKQPFQDALRTDLAKNGGRALVFIHGYNTAFDAAVYRMTQIVHDAGYTGTPILFTWASSGNTVDYVYDGDSATAARDALEKTLRAVAKAGAKHIDIIAHSMGNWVTMEALRQLAITGDRDLEDRLGDVVLASPDIDVDVFKSQMARYGVPDRPFILFVSGDDRALRLSGFIAGRRPRVGDYGDAADLAKLGVITVDLTKVRAGDSLNHTKFADNPVLIRILGERLRRDKIEITEADLNESLGKLTANLTGTIASTAEVIITTPVRVIRIAAGAQ